MTTLNGSNFRDVFATTLANGWLATPADAAAYIDNKARVLASCGVPQSEIINLCLDMEDMARGHFEAQYPRYERCGDDVSVQRYEGDVKRFYCTAVAWQYSPACREGKSLLIAGS